MKIITPGHEYELDNFEGGDRQPLSFIHKVSKGESLVTVKNGTTNEEVLAVLIDRLNFLHLKLPSRQSAIAITKLQEALMWLQNRTQERIARGVEGTHVA